MNAKSPEVSIVFGFQLIDNDRLGCHVATKAAFS